MLVWLWLRRVTLLCSAQDRPTKRWHGRLAVLRSNFLLLYEPTALG